MAYGKEESEKSVWNIDDEILKIIKDLKILFLKYMKDWKLEDAYWTLDLVCMECDAKLKSEERDDVKADLKTLETNRQVFLKDENKNRGEFYVSLRDLYKKINLLMKRHGVWFREHEDNEEET